jgi:DNA-binding NarL/FixJ family response regulator
MLETNVVTRENNSKTRILIVDDHPFMREGLKLHLNRQADFAVCAEASDLASALEAIQQSNPELVLLELKLRHGDVLEFIKAARARFPSLRILILSEYEEALYAERALRAGAHGYVMKRERADEVIAALRKVMSGELYVSRSIASLLLTKLLQAPTSTQPKTLETLSDREFQVFHMLGAGLGSRQIATQLNLSIKTIETYRENIKHKFGLRNASQLIQHATSWLHDGGVGKLAAGLNAIMPLPLHSAINNFASPRTSVAR